jgi:hypothetical protein
MKIAWITANIPTPVTALITKNIITSMIAIAHATVIKDRSSDYVANAVYILM